MSSIAETRVGALVCPWCKRLGYSTDTDYSGWPFNGRAPAWVTLTCGACGCEWDTIGGVIEPGDPTHHREAAPDA